MTSISAKAHRPLNRWDFDSIRPGPVGSVGDALLNIRLKSTVDGDFRWDPMSAGKRECKFGSNVTDGFWTSYSTSAGPPRVYDSFWTGDRDFKTNHGWEYHDLRATDRSETAILQATPQYTWRTKVANVNRAQTAGSLFAIPAGGLIDPPAGGLMRGGMFPSVVAATGGERPPPGFSGVGQNQAQMYRDTDKEGNTGYQPGNLMKV
jgi:hypothetical protein